jgi:serine/threonine protein phosphatase PrpC
MGSYLSANSGNGNETEIFQKALSHAYDELDKVDTSGPKKMGTTMTCLYLNDKGALVAHIGDSRIYHIRPSYVDIENKRLGILYQSSDHSLVNDLVKAGELTEEEARNFPQKNIITRAMQPNLERRPKADVILLNDVKPGDYFFLCCDGVLEQLTNEKLSEILADESTSDEEKLQAIKSVCDNQTRDNYTCLLIPVDGVEQDAVVADEPNSEMLVAEIETVNEVSGKKDDGEAAQPIKRIELQKAPVKRQRKAIWIVVAVLIVAILYALYVSVLPKQEKAPRQKRVNKIEHRHHNSDSAKRKSVPVVKPEAPLKKQIKEVQKEEQLKEKSDKADKHDNANQE